MAALERVLVSDSRAQRFVDQVVKTINPLLKDLGDGELHILNAAGEPALKNGWKQYGDPSNLAGGFRREAGGFVSLQGLIKSGTAAAGTVLFTLPAGYCPIARAHYAVASNSAFGFVRVDTTGEVRIFAGSNVWLALDGVRFKVK
jgi:hypothetical protein